MNEPKWKSGGWVRLENRSAWKRTMEISPKILTIELLYEADLHGPNGPMDVIRFVVKRSLTTGARHLKIDGDWDGGDVGEWVERHFERLAQDTTGLNLQLEGATK